MICGGSSQVQIEDRHRQILESVVPLMNSHLNAHHTYTLVSVKQQVVAGMNYDMQTVTEDEKQVHVKVFVPLPHTNSPPQITICEYVI